MARSALRRRERRVRSTCPDRPIRAHLTVTSATGKTVAKASTDPAGRFHIPLPAERYTMHATNTTGTPVAAARSFEFTVTRDAFTTLTVHFDSGLR